MGGLQPVATIIALDNGKKGRRTIEELKRYLEKRDARPYLEGCDSSYNRRDLPNPVNFSSNYPKRVLHVYAQQPYILDKTPAHLDLGLAENESVDNMVKVLEKKH